MKFAFDCTQRCRGPGTGLEPGPGRERRRKLFACNIQLFKVGADSYAHNKRREFVNLAWAARRTQQEVSQKQKYKTAGRKNKNLRSRKEARKMRAIWSGKQRDWVGGHRNNRELRNGNTSSGKCEGTHKHTLVLGQRAPQKKWRGCVVYKTPHTHTRKLTQTDTHIHTHSRKRKRVTVRRTTRVFQLE